MSPGTITFADLVAVHSGDVTTAPVPESPIEILVVDIAKHWTLSDSIVRSFSSYLTPRWMMLRSSTTRLWR